MQYPAHLLVPATSYLSTLLLRAAQSEHMPPLQWGTRWAVRVSGQGGMWKRLWSKITALLGFKVADPIVEAICSSYLNFETIT